jgi:hypothetical protein
VVIRMPDDEATALYSSAQRLVDLEEAEARRIAGGGEVGCIDGAPIDSVESACSLESANDLDEGASSEVAPDAASASGFEATSDQAPVAGLDETSLAGLDQDSETDSDVVAAVQACQRPRGARMADAVLVALQAAVAAGGSDSTGADRDTLVVHLDGEAMASGAAQAMEVPVPVDTPHGPLPAMSRRALQRMACEAGLVLVTTDRSGTPVDVGRKERRLSTALRRALLARDRSCRFPGCGARRHLHGHHIWHWADGGPTDLDNLVVLCSFHHRYVHDHDIGIRLRPGTAHEFRHPDGRRIARTRPLTPDGDREGGAWNEADTWPALSADALEPTDWDGRYDLDTTVAVLQQQIHAVLPHAAGALAA